eukprot:1153699-Pelagomonas_calceolata.AAC.13
MGHIFANTHGHNHSCTHAITTVHVFASGVEASPIEVRSFLYALHGPDFYGLATATAVFKSTLPVIGL